MRGGDYTKYSFIIAAMVLAAMLIISLIPPFTLFGVEFKRANIISDIYKFNDTTDSDKEALIAQTDLEFIADMESKAEQDSKNPITAITTTWSIEGLSSDDQIGDEQSNIATEQSFEGVVKIEDFSDGSSPSISDFCALLGTATHNRVVRLGFLGDSYIEGDIITADVREALQSTYGGGGVGFVPFSTPLAQNRPTITHKFEGWNNYNLINKRRAPEELQESFYVSGVLSTPSAGRKKTWVKYENTNFRASLKRVTAARLLFKNWGETEIKMVVNDSIERLVNIEASEGVQQINISAQRINSLEVGVTGDGEFVGYGVVMEGKRGVSVDNYSIRSNSGMALFGTNSAVNREIDQILHYDMIVLQYGLNIMQADITSYTNYGEQLKRVINWIKTAFPNSTIVLFGVGDRSTQEDGEFVSMPAVKGMIKAQRAAAKECGVAFWSIYDAMGGEGGMKRYVEWGWAAKDYTHLSFGGGRQIAKQFVKALEYTKAYPGERFQRDDNHYRVEYIDMEQPKDTIVETELTRLDSLTDDGLGEILELENLERVKPSHQEELESKRSEESEDEKIENQEQKSDTVGGEVEIRVEEIDTVR